MTMIMVMMSSHMGRLARQLKMYSVILYQFEPIKPVLTKFCYVPFKPIKQVGPLALDLDIDVKHPAKLTTAEIEAWQNIRAGNPALYSPYFHPDYAQLVGELRKDARIAIAYDKGKPVCFFPFQGSGFARPLGAPMTDYHGFIEAANAGINHTEFLQGADIGALHYTSMVGEQNDMVGFHRDEYPLCLIDLSDGVESWRASRSKSYRRSLKSNRRRIRRTEEEFGPRRFEYKARSGVAFDQLLAWKRERFSETGLYDVLSADWTSGMLRELWERDSGLRCDLHVLYFGDQMAAMDMGLTDGETFHSWIVGYSPDFHSLSPGTQLLEDMIDNAPELGYRLIDLGAGMDSYKSAYAVEGHFACSGFVPVAGAAAAISKLYGAAEKFGEKSLKDIPGKLRRRYTQIADCDDTVSGRAKAMFDAVKTGGSR